MDDTLMYSIIAMSLLAALALACLLYKCRARIAQARSGGSLADPLNDDDVEKAVTKDGKLKRADPAVALLYKQVKELQHFQDKTVPEHVRLVQQELVNRKIFEQLNSQQKHINEVISSQDKILREQLHKLDLVERQEDCLIEKIDEFMRETITETARAMQGETEHHHYKQRKLQQTLLSQAAERTAGLIDTAAMEAQINELKGLFHRSQEERQTMMATIQQTSTDLRQQQLVSQTLQNSYSFPALDKAPQAAPIRAPDSSGGGSPDSSFAGSPSNRRQPLSSVVVAHPHRLGDRALPKHTGPKPHPPGPPASVPLPPSTAGYGKGGAGGGGGGGGGSTFPYPQLRLKEESDSSSDGGEPLHGSPRAADAARALPRPHTATMDTQVVPLHNVPPALMQKRARQKEAAAAAAAAAAPGGSVAQQAEKSLPEGETYDWWSSIGNADGPLRDRDEFEKVQRKAEAFLPEEDGGGGGAGGDDLDSPGSGGLPPPPVRRIGSRNSSMTGGVGAGAAGAGVPPPRKRRPSSVSFASPNPGGYTFTSQGGGGGGGGSGGGDEDDDDDLAFAQPAAKKYFQPWADP